MMAWAGALALLRLGAMVLEQGRASTTKAKAKASPLRGPKAKASPLRGPKAKAKAKAKARA